MPVAVTAALAGALALGAYAGSIALLVAVVATQAVLVFGWHRTVDVPAALGGAVIASAAALSADALVAARDDSRPLVPLAGVLGAVVLAAFIHQLSLRENRARVTDSMTATVALSVLVVFAAFYLAADDTRGTGGAAAPVAVVALGVLAARLVDWAPLPPRHRAGLAVLAGAVVGLVGGALTSEFGTAAGVALGAAAGVTAVTATVLARGDSPPASATVAALPLAAAGPVAYVLARLLIG
jgi:hypothetical protein